MMRKTMYVSMLIHLLVTGIGYSDDGPPAAATTQASSEVAGQFVVHEWGTFTTFSGSDGVFLDFRPLAQEHSDLPSYVLDRANYSTLPTFNKRRLRGRVRMETPVTYFYTDRVRSVDVSVDFPKGLLTEFYPPVRKIAPPFDAKVAYNDGEPIGNSSLDWGTVELIPQQALAPNIANAELRSSIAETLARNAVPHGANEHHYAQARATDSALVYVPSTEFQPFGTKRGHFEKFLFYRGVGSFELPIGVSFEGETPVFTNSGTLPVHSAILIESRSGVIRAKKIKQIDAGEQQAFDVANVMNVNQLADLVRESLVDEGLYAKEAQSMVNTWRNSWFTEEGRRVLYMVPAEITDELLPLHINPAPQESLRVLVGRMEIMSPADESKLTVLVRKSMASRVVFERKHDQKQRGAPKYVVPDSLKTWGRMLEPALTRIAKTADELPVQREAKQLLEGLRKNG